MEFTGYKCYISSYENTVKNELWVLCEELLDRECATLQKNKMKNHVKIAIKDVNLYKKHKAGIMKYN